ncbi:uncharacterized protein LOC113273080 [Papaver somniferum]|uniref:uncharacterized protein LOC113273080 n=1 Tax=Papaver somniferum TaxID=3469 RepID=UPI000E6FF9E6|nr:uncharacterized protein LOC113273080 [Papaver somniferum]
MRVLFWNINGVAREAARDKLKELIKDFKPDIFCIAEPKVYCSDKFVQGLHISGYMRNVIHNSVGRLKGNIWIFWSEEMVMPNVINSSKQAVTIEVDGVMISFIHASCIQVTIRNLWQQLSSRDCTTPWLVMGDFNYVLHNEEKRGGREPRTSVINEFADWMDDNDLFEADSLGSKFTWANGQSGVRRILCKLDRALINEAWLNKFENWRCKALPREVSDHSAIIGFPITFLRPKRAPFRFQKMWFVHNDFMRLVKENWNAPVLGSPAFIFPFKLKRLKIGLKEWNMRVFGNVHARFKQAKLTLEVALRISDEDPEDVSKLNAAKDASIILQDIRAQQAIMLKQKTRSKWLLEGASNTSFFHANTKTRRSNNMISELVDGNGNVLTDFEQIRDHVVSFYEAKFNGSDLTIEEDLFEYEHNIISVEDSQRMDAIPTLDEFKEAVFNLGADSAPGPDGFSGCFYRHCWEIIQQDLYNATIYCWTVKVIPQGTNSSLLILIAKVKGANTLNNFRPIGLSNFFFKIFTKILATRLGSVLDNLVSEEQVALMKGRNIHENISVASEMVNDIKTKRKDGNVGLKLDITQAFDTVSWSFVLEVFRRYGFSDNWCSWILSILNSARIYILLNGNPEGFFKINRGLRQGDPLSPLIFVLIEDVLSRNLTKLFLEKKMTPMLSKRGISPTHLFFADDIMIFCKGNMKSLNNLLVLLGKYQAASGQSVFRHKSKVYYGGGSLSRCRTITDLLDMSVTTFPDRYLGVQIMLGAVRYRHISNVIDKIKNQLAVWKGKLLSFQDRIVLINSVIASYTIHNMAVYKWPKKFIQQAERVIRNFLWSGDAEIARKFVVGFPKVCCPLKEGGLGITSMETTNRAMLMKLWWSIRSSQKKWARFLWAKYTYTCGRLKRYGVKSSIFPGIKVVQNLVDNNTKVLLGDGRSTSLYYDVWYGTQSIADILGNHELDFSTKVSDILIDNALHLQGVHGQVLMNAGVEASNMPVLRGGVDCRVWMHDLHGVFTVKSAKELIRKKYTVLEDFGLLRRKSNHPKLAAQNWKLCREACATSDKIRSRFKVELSNRCYLCKCEEESLYHILWTCSYATQVWEWIAGIFSLQPHFNIVDAYKVSKGRSRITKDLWLLSILVVRAELWHARNLEYFENKSISIHFFKQRVFSSDS